MLLCVMDPEGARRRKQNRLARHVYQNKVHTCSGFYMQLI